MAGVDAELVLLRSFYTAWVNMHTIPRDGMHRRQQEEAAQELVDCGHAMRLFYQGSETAKAARAKPELVVVHSMAHAEAEATNGG